MLENTEAEGNLVIRTLAMPRDTNANGDIFGGWLLSQMDLGGAIEAKKISNSRVVTVAIDAMSFIKPVHVGDVICCYAKLLKQGRSSMHIQMQAWALAPTDHAHPEKVTQGAFTYVAIDQNGKPQPIEKGG